MVVVQKGVQFIYRKCIFGFILHYRDKVISDENTI